MPANTWNEKEKEYLMLNYSLMSNNDISLILNKKISTIKEYARRKGLRKKYDFHEKRRIGNFTNLLKETPETYYWIGFIFADGNLSKKGRLSITTSWDNDHLENFAKFINGKVSINKKSKSKKNYKGSREFFYRVSIADATRYNELSTKFNISNKKTYFPPDLKFLNSDWKFYSFLIGFIDGDGNITNKSTQIINHLNWKTTHEYISNWLKIHNIKSSVKTDSNNESKLYISRNFYDLMKIFIIENNLPVLDRKWNNNL